MQEARTAAGRPPRRGSARLNVAEAKQRARNVKAALVTVAVALFALVGVAVRAAHPGAGSSRKAVRANRLSALSAPSAFETALNQHEDFNQGGGFVAPAAGPPVAATSTS